MTGKIYNPGQLDLLLWHGKTACIKAGYDKDFVERAYDQITEAIEDQAAEIQGAVAAAEEPSASLNEEIDNAFVLLVDGVSPADLDEMVDTLEEDFFAGDSDPADDADEDEEVDAAVVLVKELLQEVRGSRAEALGFGTIELVEEMEELLAEYVNQLIPNGLAGELAAIALVTRLNREQWIAGFVEAAGKVMRGAECLIDGLTEMATTLGDDVEDEE